MISLSYNKKMKLIQQRMKNMKIDKHLVAVVVTCIVSMWITDFSYHKFYFHELYRKLIDMTKNRRI